MADPSATTSSPSWADRVLAVALFGVAFGYWAAWPHNLGHSDESHFYYHSMRVLEGAVPYRDFFEFYTPLAFYGMAAVFGVFGAQIGTAKIAMAVVHATTTGLVFACGRRLGARRIVAGAGGLAFLALGPPAWHFGSPHWIATALLVALLFVLVDSPLTRMRLIGAGVLTAILTSMQQQTGVPIALGIGGAIVLEHFLDGRFGGPESGPLVRKLLWFGVPAFALTAAVLLAAMIAAGPWTVFEQLVVHPLTGYRSNIRSGWGAVSILTHSFSAYTFPSILKFLPPVLILFAVLRLGLAWRVGERSRFGRLPTLTVFSIATVTSVFYYPDFIHLAFVIAVFLVVLVEAIEWAVASAPSLPVNAAAALAVLVTSVHMYVNLERARDAYAVSGQTAFGRVDFASRQELELFERVRDELEGNRTRELLCYPVCTSLFLTANGNNASKHLIMLPDYLTPDAYQETIELLEERRVRNVVIVPEFVALETDAMLEYVRSRYRCIDDTSPCWIYRREDLGRERHLEPVSDRAE